MRWLREPTVHFLALGAGLFLLFGLVGERAEAPRDRIEVGAQRVELLRETFRRTWQRPPTAQELEGLIEEYVREEVYYREALTMGLDRDDTIVRRRLRQKLEFLTADLIDAAEPGDEELRRYFDIHAERFQTPMRLAFEHVFVSHDRRGDDAERDARRLLATLAEADREAAPETLGDTLMLPRAFDEVTEDEVARLFGRVFAEGLAKVAVGAWSGPIESGYGLHLVRVERRRQGSRSAFEAVRDAVEQDWRTARRQEAGEAFYRGLRQRYDVVVATPTAEPGEPRETSEPPTRISSRIPAREEP